jgi:hypothetical protein
MTLASAAPKPQNADHRGFRCFEMSTAWGNHTLGPGQAVGWYFNRIYALTETPLILINVLPMSVTNVNAEWSIPDFSVGYPQWNLLSASNLWSQITLDDLGRELVTYYMIVMNLSNQTIQYAFVEQDFQLQQGE